MDGPSMSPHEEMNHVFPPRLRGKRRTQFDVDSYVMATRGEVSKLDGDIRVSWGEGKITERGRGELVINRLRASGWPAQNKKGGRRMREGGLIVVVVVSSLLGIAFFKPHHEVFSVSSCSSTLLTFLKS